MSNQKATELIKHLQNEIQSLQSSLQNRESVIQRLKNYNRIMQSDWEQKEEKYISEISNLNKMIEAMKLEKKAWKKKMKEYIKMKKNEIVYLKEQLAKVSQQSECTNFRQMSTQTDEIPNESEKLRKLECLCQQQSKIIETLYEANAEYEEQIEKYKQLLETESERLNATRREYFEYVKEKNKEHKFSVLNNIENHYVHTAQTTQTETTANPSSQSVNIDKYLNNATPINPRISKQLNNPPEVILYPEFLDFNERPLCVPTVLTIEVTNNAKKKELKINSVSTDSLHFHPDVPKETSNIEPGGKASITVVFLPRSVGKVEASLIIHTNYGTIIYELKGKGIENQYQIRPILGQKLPIDMEFSKPISIYNPYSEKLTVKEIFTSENFLLLSLPEPKTPGGTLWEIPPHQTKTVIFLNFLAKQAGKYQGFIHIKSDKDTLIIHVEFIVSKRGVHSVVDEIQFGTLTSATEKKTKSIALLNSSPTPVLVSDVYVATPDSLLEISFQKGTILREGAVTKVASVTYRGNVEGNFEGKIYCRTNDSNPVSSRIEIPYKSRVIHGSIDYFVNSTAFYVGKPPFKDVISPMIFLNRFSVPVQFKTAEIHDDNFSVVDFKSGLVLQPKEKAKVLSIRFKANDTNLLYSNNLILETNVTRLLVPLHCFHGKLQYLPYYSDAETTKIESIPKPIKSDKSRGRARIHFGIIAPKTKKSHEFVISNPNPVPIPIEDWYLKFNEQPHAKLSIEWIRMLDAGNTTLLSKTFVPLDIREDYKLILEPNQHALFRIDICTESEEEVKGSLIIKTIYDNLAIPIEYISMDGSLSFSKKLHFGNAFPGRVIKKPIYATNTYSRKIRITGIESSDKRFIPVLQKHIIQPNQKMKVGHILFDATEGGKTKNYMDTVQITDQSTYVKTPITKEEMMNYKLRKTLFDKLKGKKELNITGIITLQTNVLNQYSIQVSTSLIQPKLSLEKKIDFKLNQIGTSSSRFIQITNPSDFPVKLELVLVTVDDQFSLAEDCARQVLVQPHKQVNLGPVIHSPKSQSLATAKLYIKNNLTIFDVVKLQGVGGNGYIVFQKDGKDVKVLNFDVQEDEIGTWNNKQFTRHTSNFKNHRQFITFTRSFTLVNKGNLPVKILDSCVSGTSCEAYGIKIDRCGKSFETMILEPGQSKVFNISFTPDFTTSKISVTIDIHTTQGKFSVPMILTVPHHLLPYLYGIQPITRKQYIMRITCTVLVLAIAVYLIFRTWKDLRSLDRQSVLPVSLDKVLQSLKPVNQQEYQEKTHDDDVEKPPVEEEEKKKEVQQPPKQTVSSPVKKRTNEKRRHERKRSNKSKRRVEKKKEKTEEKQSIIDVEKIIEEPKLVTQPTENKPEEKSHEEVTREKKQITPIMEKLKIEELKKTPIKEEPIIHPPLQQTDNQSSIDFTKQNFERRFKIKRRQRSSSDEGIGYGRQHKQPIQKKKHQSFHSHTLPRREVEQIGVIGKAIWRPQPVQQREYYSPYYPPNMSSNSYFSNEPITLPKKQQGDQQIKYPFYEDNDHVLSKIATLQPSNNPTNQSFFALFNPSPERNIISLNAIHSKEEEKETRKSPPTFIFPFPAQKRYHIPKQESETSSLFSSSPTTAQFYSFRTKNKTDNK